jgi:hypothetical protein
LPTDILQEIGAYAGLAAVVGLAVLSALYFSQARDLKRLREWAGRAPERAAEQQAQSAVAPATPAGRVVAQPQTRPAGPVPVPGGQQAAGAAAAASAAGARPASATAAPGAAALPAAATPAGQGTLADATGERDELETGEGEAVGVAAESDRGETGEGAVVGVGAEGETGEGEAVGAGGEDDRDGGAAGVGQERDRSETGEGEAPGERQPSVAAIGDGFGETGEGDAVGAEREPGEADDREAVGAGDQREGIGAGNGATDEQDAVGGADEAGDRDAERVAPPEGEPAVAAARTDDDEEGAEEAAEREPVGAHARAHERVVAQSGLAAPPATPAGGMGTAGNRAPARPVAPASVPGRAGPPPVAPRQAGRPPLRPGGPRPSQTAILPPPARSPWYRRLWRSPRYLVLVVAGILIVGGGAAFGVVQLTKEDSGGSGPPTAGGDGGTGNQDQGGGGSGSRQTAVDPSKVTVAVLNGTTVPGLAAQIGDKIGSFGFQVGNITNSTDQQRAESVILYAPGHKREGAAVARRLRISQREAIDPESQSLAGDASVVVIPGIDQTR